MGGLNSVSATKVLLTLEMQDFEKGKETYSLSEEEKVTYSSERKEMGSKLFRKGRIDLAMERYKKVIDLFSYIDSYKEDNKIKAKDLKKTCQLNRAACQLKIHEYFAAKTSCNDALQEDSQNVKALFRRAQAELGLKNFLECMTDLKKLIELDPQNKEARSLYKQAQVAQKEEDKKSKGLFTKMCSGFGRGPIPTPSREKRKRPEDENAEAMEIDAATKDGEAAAKDGEADGKDVKAAAKDGEDAEMKPSEEAVAA